MSRYPWSREPKAQASVVHRALSLAGRYVDSVLGVVAPRAAFRRMAYRNRSDALLNYEAAERRFRDQRKAESADKDLLHDLPEIRQRSRVLVRDDPHAAAIINVLVNNVVGTGLRPQAACTAESTGLAPAAVQAWNHACEEHFYRWSQKWCDPRRRLTFEQMQRLVCRIRLVDGEALVHRLELPLTDGRRASVAWELVDADRLVSPTLQETDTMRGGVELDGHGAPIRYHITPRHPQDVTFRGANQPQPVARWLNGEPNVLHVYRDERAGQNRGVPVITPAIPMFDFLHAWMNAELKASVALSRVVMAVKRTPPTGSDLMSELRSATTGDDGTTQLDRDFLEKWDELQVNYLGDHEEMQAFQPNRPGTTFAPGLLAILRAICAGADLPYVLVLKDYMGLNFSSAKASHIQAGRGFDAERRIVVDGFCTPSWETVIRDAVRLGELIAPAGWALDQQRFLDVEWVANSLGWLDPVREVQASGDAIRLGLSTPQVEAARNGLDAFEIVEQRARHLQFVRDKELEFGLPAGSLDPAVKPAAPPAPPAGAEAEDEDDDEVGENNAAAPRRREQSSEPKPPSKAPKAPAKAGEEPVQTPAPEDTDETEDE